MHIRVFFLLSFWLLARVGNGQIVLSLPAVPPGAISPGQLWNLTVINGGPSAMTATVQLLITDGVTQQLLMTAETRPVNLPKGIRTLQGQDLAPIHYMPMTAAFSPLAAGNGLLPIGIYRLCYRVMAMIGEARQAIVVAEECVAVEVAPQAPPALISPPDTSKVATPYPLFQWLPPAPLPQFTQLRYDLVVAEVRPGQSPSAALEQNLPVFSAPGLLQAVENYPASFKGLDTGKVYAWRIVARNGPSFAAASEIWTFRLAPPLPDPPAPGGGGYLTLVPASEAATTALIAGNRLNLQYYSFETDHDGTVVITGPAGDSLLKVGVRITYGQNFLTIPLSGNCSGAGIYGAWLSDLRGNRYRSFFRNTNSH